MSILSVLPEELVRFREPMKNHTTFRIGGNADIMVFPQNIDQIETAVSWANNHQIPYFVLGSGSNLLVRDGGIRGLVIKLTGFSQIRVDEKQIFAQAGASLADIALRAADASLTGVEFAEGIPGTVGGAIVMNAGAYNRELSDVLESVTVLMPDGGIRQFMGNELEYGYRTSILQRNGGVVLEAALTLEKGNPEVIKQRIAELHQQRCEKQPLELPSAGSVFRRPSPEGPYVGPMIQELGLKGMQVGGASVSLKHAGFIVNDQETATAEDVIRLIQLIQSRVFEKYGIHLKTEIQIVGEQDTK